MNLSSHPIASLFYVAKITVRRLIEVFVLRMGVEYMMLVAMETVERWLPWRYRDVIIILTANLSLELQRHAGLP